jgi:hypothetical protein
VELGEGLSEMKHLEDLGIYGMAGLVNAVTSKRVQKCAVTLFKS